MPMIVRASRIRACSATDRGGMQHIMSMFDANWFRRRDDATPPSAGDMDTLLAAAVKRDFTAPLPATASDPVWVIYASETGVAEQLARATCRALQDTGVASRLLPFDELDLGKLQAIGQALFLVSTCYDGDPPDMAEEFCREHMVRPRGCRSCAMACWRWATVTTMSSALSATTAPVAAGERSTNLVRAGRDG